MTTRTNQQRVEDRLERIEAKVDLMLLAAKLATPEAIPERFMPQDNDHQEVAS